MTLNVHIHRKTFIIPRHNDTGMGKEKTEKGSSKGFSRLVKKQRLGSRRCALR